ncbi:MAG: hypothetical protein J0I20_31620 [Chloroflexi bacterium]|nr:hypothetical protein [Chloroflexota bacterium]OJV93678.1 MAG: hypothetical protein BGO39_15285 [Chloroflexi bacterium 54-19]
MPDNPSFPNYPSYQQPALEPDELDEATLDRVIGGLDSPKELQETQMSFPLVYPQIQNGIQGENRSYSAVSKIMGPNMILSKIR